MKKNELKIGDILYFASANEVFNTFFKVEINTVYDASCWVKPINDYGSCWKSKTVNHKPLNVPNSCLFKTFEEAKIYLLKELDLKNNRDFIRHYFQFYE